MSPREGIVKKGTRHEQLLCRTINALGNELGKQGMGGVKWAGGWAD